MAVIRAMPILMAKDVAASAGFYDGLGFHCHGFLGDPPSFAVVQRGDVTIGLNAAEAPRPTPAGAWAAYIYVSDVDAMHAEMAATRPPEITGLSDQPYGCRDFQISDPDGNRIAFGQDMITTDAPPGLSPLRGAG